MSPTHPYLATAPPRAFAHRGWHLDDLADMENSLSALRRASAEGYRYIETDVHSTSDGVLVVHHDENLERTTDGSGPIREQRWERVRRARIGGREPIARLEDALEELPDVAFNVDVKDDAAVEPMVRTMNRTGAFDRVAVASFSDSRLGRIRRLAGPKLLTALGPRAAGVLRAGGWLPQRLLGGFLGGSMAQVPVHFGRLPVIDQAFVRSASRLGVEVHAWTVNEAERMRTLLDIGVRGIVTDRPDVLRDVLAERDAWRGNPLA